MTIVIAGCGDLGTEAGLRFVEAGHRVVGIRRNAAVLPESFEARSADLTNDDIDLPDDTEAVVIATTPDERTPEGYRRAYVDTLKGLLDAVDRLPVRPRRLVWVSSTAVYGVDDGRWLDESSPLEATSGTAAVVIEAEEIFRVRVPDGVILRLGGIYGPGRDRLIGQVRAGGEFSSPDHWVNLIHRDDAAAAIVHLVTGVADPAPVYLGVDGRPALRRDIATFVAERLGIDPPELPAASDSATGKRLANDLLAATGFTWEYPDYRAGYAALLEDKRSRHP